MIIEKKIDLSDSTLMCPTCYELYPVSKCVVNIDLQIPCKTYDILNPNINHRYIFHEGNRIATDVYPKHQSVPALISVPCPDCDVQMIRIDKGIADYISLMNKLGMRTYYSCAGHKLVDEDGWTHIISPYVVFASDHPLANKKINDFNCNTFDLKAMIRLQYNFNGYLSHGFLKRNTSTYATIELDSPFDIIHRGGVRLDDYTVNIFTYLLAHQLFSQLIKGYINSMSQSQKNQKRDVIDRALKYFDLERKFYDENESSIIDNLQRAIDKYHKS